MFPIKDENPTRTFPFVNYALIAANIAAYVWQSLLMRQSGDTAIVTGYGLVATRLLVDPLGEGFTIFTSMFMHGGWGHLASNMLFLYIFGDNVEDAMGHGRYFLYYLACGVAAGLVQVAVGPHSSVPMVGASGAIAAVNEPGHRTCTAMNVWANAQATTVNVAPVAHSSSRVTKRSRNMYRSRAKLV
jgi:membrane associated rhomboid family serine protease